MLSLILSAMATKPTKQPKQPTVQTVDVVESSDSIARRTFIILTVIVGFGLLLWFMVAIRNIILLLVIAGIFALTLAPAVGWMTKHGWKRGLAAFTAVLVSLILILGVVGAAAAPLFSQTDDLIQSAPNILNDIRDASLVKQLDSEYQIIDKAQELVREAPNYLTSHQSNVVDAAKSTFGTIANILVIIILTFFLLLEGPQSWRTLTALFRPHHAKRVERTGTKIAEGLSGYVTGNLFISVIAGIVAFVTLSILGVPYAFPLAVVVAIFDLIPMIGATIATIILAIVALSVSLTAAIIVTVVMIVYQQVEGNVIQPVVYGRTVRLSPLLVLVATLIGAQLGGIIGVLLAIPAAAAVQTIALEILQGTSAGRRAQLSNE